MITKIKSPKSKDNLVIFAQKMASKKILIVVLKVREVSDISETIGEVSIFVKISKVVSEVYPVLFIFKIIPIYEGPFASVSFFVFNKKKNY